jgi:hypothetical protein
LFVRGSDLRLSPFVVRASFPIPGKERKGSTGARSGCWTNWISWGKKGKKLSRQRLNPLRTASAPSLPSDGPCRPYPYGTFHPGDGRTPTSTKKWRI